MIDKSLIERARRGNADAMRTLIALLSDDDYYTAEAASESFWRVGRRSTPPLLALLRDREALRQARVLAAEALNHLGSYEGTTAQLELLQDENEDMELRRILALYVTYLGDERALEPLIEIARDEGADRVLRVRAVMGLGHLRDRRAAETLRYLRQQGDPALRHQARLGLDRLEGDHHEP